MSNNKERRRKFPPTIPLGREKCCRGETHCRSPALARRDVIYTITTYSIYNHAADNHEDKASGMGRETKDLPGISRMSINHRRMAQRIEYHLGTQSLQKPISYEVLHDLVERALIIEMVAAVRSRNGKPLGPISDIRHHMPQSIRDKNGLSVTANDILRHANVPIDTARLASNMLSLMTDEEGMLRPGPDVLSEALKRGMVLEMSLGTEVNANAAPTRH